MSSAPDSSEWNATRQPIRYERCYLISKANLLGEEICLRATSLTGTDPDTRLSYLHGIGCHTWSCGFCARVKVRIMAARTRLAGPNRLMTLTVNPGRYADPRAAFEATAHQVPELIRLLRKRFGEVEYLRVTEATKKGYPHYHLLIRSAYLPQPVVKAEWERLTGNTIVDCRQVRECFSAYNYLVKYLTKMHSLEWTERHVSRSRAFWPDEPKYVSPTRRLEQITRAPIHPLLHLARWYAGEVAIRNAPMVWTLPDEPASGAPFTIHPRDLALPWTNAPRPPEPSLFP